ncbi:MAG: hypothetical protein QW575_04520 [Thermoproteota archaeon]
MTTREELLRAIEYLNEITGDKEHPYKLLGAYGKVQLGRVYDERSKSIDTVTGLMFMPELLDTIHAMQKAVINFKEAKKQRKSHKELAYA